MIRLRSMNGKERRKEVKNELKRLRLIVKKKRRKKRENIIFFSFNLLYHFLLWPLPRPAKVKKTPRTKERE